MTLVCGQSSNPCGKSVLYFINLISQMDDIQGVSARTVGGQVDLEGVGGGVVRSVRPPLATGLVTIGHMCFYEIRY